MTRDQALRVEFKPGALPLVFFAVKAETTARPAGDAPECAAVSCDAKRQARGD
jgi:hypothetical protein